jgi:hypothetical protein
MPIENLKPWLFAAWMVGVCLVAMALGVTSVTHWMIVAFIAVVPAAVARSLWRVPEPTMSESIHDARR